MSKVSGVYFFVEMVRKCLLLHFQEALEEIDSYTIEETLRKCGETAPENIKPRSGFSRRGRAYQFLMFVFENDALVLELKNVLEDRGLGHFFSIFLADVEEDTKGNTINDYSFMVTCINFVTVIRRHMFKFVH